jgi:penicillin G amidase
MPSIWYLNGLHGGRFNTVGYTFPGVPLVIIGHNDRIAWGVTDMPADVQDLYIEKLDDPANPTKYEYQGQWYDLTIDRQTIEVKNQAPVTLEVRSTRHGPIINDTDSGLKQAEPLALRWTALAGTNLFRGVVALNLAQDWPAFLQALQFWDTPNQHFVYADVDGNIGYQSAGLLPLRAPGHDGLLPVPGWTGTYEWQGTVGADKLYGVLNPPNDFFTTANDRVVPADHPYQAAYGLDWAGANFTVERISEGLEAGNALSLDDMTNFQVDNVAIPATRMLPYLLAIQPENELEERALTIMRDWNQRFERDQVGASIYRAWFFYMTRYTFTDNITEGLGSRYEGVGWLNLPVLLSIMDQPDNEWFDDAKTPEREGRDDITRRSFVDALALLQQHYGQDPEQWTWGRMHRLNLRAQPLGQTGVSLVDNIFNSGYMPADGGDFTINNSWLNSRAPFQVAGGPAQRFVIDVGDWDASRAANSTGQSEHLFHPHRMDIVRLWVNSQYHPMLFSRAAVDSHREGVLLLAPQR